MRERQSAPPKTKDARESAAHARVGVVTPFQHGDCWSVRPAMCVSTHTKVNQSALPGEFGGGFRRKGEYRISVCCCCCSWESWSRGVKVEPMIELPVLYNTVQYCTSFYS